MSGVRRQASDSTLDPDLKRRAELRGFLRAKRAAVPPESAGLPRGKRRLTPGLRREEVAMLADVGVTWYTWLEQGRRINMSASTLQRVSNALRLTETEEGYLFTLARVARPHAQKTDVGPLSTLQRVVDGFIAGPAVVFGPTFDALAYNSRWARIYRPLDVAGPLALNHVHRLFTDPARRALYVDYDEVARNMVGLLRVQYASHLGVSAFEDLVQRLLADSTVFATLWNGHQPEPLAPFTLRLDIAPLGRATLDVTRFPVEGAPGMVLFFGLPADDDSAAIFAALG